MKCEFGVCLVCECEIAKTCGDCGTKKPNEHYTEVLVNLSNGTKMPLAVCVACSKQKVWNADRKAVMDAVKEGWKREQENLNWSKEQMASYEESYGHLEIID